MAKIRKYKTSSGKSFWLVDYSFEGKRKKIKGISTREDALFHKANIELRELDKKVGYKPVVRKTVDEAIEQYDLIVSSKKNSDTQILERKYFKKLTNYIETLSEDEFDGQISNIDLLFLEKFRHWLKASTYSRKKKADEKPDKNKKPLKASTINRHFNTYNNFFSRCRKWGFITIDPSMDFEPLAEEEQKIKVWKPIQVASVLKQFEPWALRVIYFIAKTGARRGEAVRLEPKDIDLSDRKLTLKSWKGGVYREREIPMTDELFAFMTEQMKLVLKNKWSKVFVDQKGDVINKTRISTQMNRAAKKAGCHGMNLHGLRHTIFTQLSAQNVNLRKIQLLAGHSSLNTTQKYLHNDLDEIRLDLEIHERRVRLGKIRETTGPNGPHEKTKGRQ